MWRTGSTITGLLLTGGLLLFADGPAHPDPGQTVVSEKPPSSPPSGEAAGAATLENWMQVSDRIYSGGEPVGEEDFARLQQLGVKTLVSVDGARPNVETAEAFGLRYVHVPIGYDGISERAGKTMARVVRDCDGPIYVHCHHGRHRGPAAAAIGAIASGEADTDRALQILEHAGTSRDYAGLWRDVASYSPPSRGTPLPEPVEVAEVDSLAAAMARIDRSFDNLIFCREANWGTPDDHPDLVPLQQALIVREGFHEAARNLPDVFGDEFREQLQTAESIARSIETALDSQKKDEATKHIQRLHKSCKACHAAHRN